MTKEDLQKLFEEETGLSWFDSNNRRIEPDYVRWLEVNLIEELKNKSLIAEKLKR